MAFFRIPTCRDQLLTPGSINPDSAIQKKMNLRMRSARIAIAAFALFQLAAARSLAQPLQPAASEDGLREASRAWKQQLADNASAPVKVVEFYDYQCPFCAATIPALEEALRSYPGKIQLVLKNDPLSIHPDSMLAHQAALAAGEQGKFWEMNDILFANQQRLKLPNLLEYARQVGLDVGRFENRLQTGYYRPEVEQDMALARTMGVE